MGSIRLLRTEASIPSSPPPESVVRAPLPVHRCRPPPHLLSQPLCLNTISLSEPQAPHLVSAVAPSISSFCVSISEASDSDLLLSPTHLRSTYLSPSPVFLQPSEAPDPLVPPDPPPSFSCCQPPMMQKTSPSPPYLTSAPQPPVHSSAPPAVNILPSSEAQSFFSSLSGQGVSGFVGNRCNSDESAGTHLSISFIPPLTTSLSFDQSKLSVLLLAGERTTGLVVPVLDFIAISVRRCIILGMAHHLLVSSSTRVSSFPESSPRILSNFFTGLYSRVESGFLFRTPRSSNGLIHSGARFLSCSMPNSSSKKILSISSSFTLLYSAAGPVIIRLQSYHPVDSAQIFNEVGFYLNLSPSSCNLGMLIILNLPSLVLHMPNVSLIFPSRERPLSCYIFRLFAFMSHWSSKRLYLFERLATFKVSNLLEPQHSACLLGFASVQVVPIIRSKSITFPPTVFFTGNNFKRSVSMTFRAKNSVRLSLLAEEQLKIVFKLIFLEALLKKLPVFIFDLNCLIYLFNALLFISATSNLYSPAKSLLLVTCF